MNRFLLLALIGAAGCAQESDRGEPPPTASPAQEVAIPMQQPQVTKTEAVLPLPEDKAQLERMVTMGYTPHDDHLHPPGVKECPISMGGDPIQ